MRTDPDYSAYVVARWAPVVRMLVVLGVPVDRADELAVATFARMLPDWGRLGREGDVDVELARMVLDTWVRTRSQEPAERVAVPVPAGRLLTQELEDQLRLLERLTDGLTRVDESTRVTVVLRHIGELDVDQVGEVLGEPRDEVNRRLSEAARALELAPLDPVCHAAGAAVDVPPPSVQRVLSRAAAGRRRRWLITAAVVVAVALVAGVAYAVGRPQPSVATLDALEVTPVENTVGVAWWLDGVLHLDHGTVPVDDVRQLVPGRPGVVYADGTGAVVTVTEEGDRKRLGTMDLDSSLLSQPALGIVVWLDEETGNLVAYNTLTDRQVAEVEHTTDLRLIAWDRGRLYFHAAGQDRSMTFTGQGGSEPEPVEPPEGAERSVLEDVSSGAKLRLQDGSLSVEQPFFNLSTPVPGTDGQLSPDGNFALTHTGNSPPQVYDARSGDPEGTFFKAGWTPLAASFTAEGRVVWVVDSNDLSFGIYDCLVSHRFVNSFDPDSDPCTGRLDVGEMPVLAGVEPGLTLEYR